MSEVVQEAREGYGSGDRLGAVQHKREAWWFYRFLSIVYDRFVNPWHWTPSMRSEALKLANLDEPNVKVLDVGGGTGFCSEGILEFGIPPENITLLDQSPHQLAKAKSKSSLNGVTFCEGDAEDLPFENDSFDRYVSAGSIEYWPEPQRGIHEAFRVIKPGGTAIIIGPESATNRLSRFMSDLWMLFPSEKEYRKWFTESGFEEIEIERICPEHFGGIRKHGLIMGIVAKGTKKQTGPPKKSLGAKLESSSDQGKSNVLQFAIRMLAGTVGGAYYFLLGFWIPLVALFRGNSRS